MSLVYRHHRQLSKKYVMPTGEENVVDGDTKAYPIESRNFHYILCFLHFTKLNQFIRHQVNRTRRFQKNLPPRTVAKVYLPDLLLLDGKPETDQNASQLSGNAFSLQINVMSEKILWDPCGGWARRFVGRWQISSHNLGEYM